MDGTFNRPPMNTAALSNAVDMFKNMAPRPTTPQMPMARAAGGAADKIVREKSTPCHTGLITMAVGGRTDHIPMNVLEGSYVLPADIVSGLGEGNTLAGSKIIDAMFSGGPFGTKTPSVKFSPLARYGTPFASTPEFNFVAQLEGSAVPGISPKREAASGGPIRSGKYKPVPIIAAGGEYVIDPDVVKALGKGDVGKGHDYLDHFVKYVRQHLIKTLQKLPGPKRD